VGLFPVDTPDTVLYALSEYFYQEKFPSKPLLGRFMRNIFQLEDEPMISRRTFLATVTGGLVAWPLVARAQPLALPVIGFLSSL